MSSATHPTMPSPADHRRSRRAQLFLAARMSARIGDSLSEQEPPVPELRHFPVPNVDLGIVVGAAPAQEEMMAWARRRQVTLMVGCLPKGGGRDELTVDTYLWDVGIVVLSGFRLFTPGGGSWWLIATGVEVVSLRLTHEGPTPTLTRPYRDNAELAQGRAKADELFAAFLRAE